MNKKIGFIGSGNMGGAIIGGIIKAGLVDPCDVFVSDMSADKLDEISAKYGVQTTTDNRVVAENADIIVAAVKPNIYSVVLEGIKDIIDDSKVIVTIAAGKTLSDIESVVGSDKKSCKNNAKHSGSCC